MAAEHKAASEKVEQQLQELQDAYSGLEKELDEKQEEIDSYEAQLQGDRDGMKFLDEIRDLKEEISQIEVEKQELQDQIDSLQRDAAQLIEKDVKVSRERSEERKTLQTVCSL
jgi:chromosome segregation ATPase